MLSRPPPPIDAAADDDNGTPTGCVRYPRRRRTLPSCAQFFPPPQLAKHLASYRSLAKAPQGNVHLEQGWPTRG
ncbi:hypothetical protein TNCV_4272301 [Trichonephila clavipes]|nr:hypothetical protein TNCV_4272301 [Trichonephila clavipes]